MVVDAKTWEIFGLDIGPEAPPSQRNTYIAPLPPKAATAQIAAADDVVDVSSHLRSGGGDHLRRVSHRVLFAWGLLAFSMLVVVVILIRPKCTLARVGKLAK